VKYRATEKRNARMKAKEKIPEVISNFPEALLRIHNMECNTSDTQN
jgi:hypothetical protein